jgi:hypothetical protein
MARTTLLRHAGPKDAVPAPFKEPWAERSFDAIDAGFFSADTFHSDAAIARAEWYMARWQREIARIREMLKEGL